MSELDPRLRAKLDEMRVNKRAAEIRAAKVVRQPLPVPTPEQIARQEQARIEARQQMWQRRNRLQDVISLAGIVAGKAKGKVPVDVKVQHELSFLGIKRTLASGWKIASGSTQVPKFHEGYGSYYEAEWSTQTVITAATLSTNGLIHFYSLHEPAKNPPYSYGRRSEVHDIVRRVDGWRDHSVLDLGTFSRVSAASRGTTEKVQTALNLDLVENNLLGFAVNYNLDI